jgi:hypothetical protein
VECSCEHGSEASGSIKWQILEQLAAGGFSRRAQLHRIS